MSDATKPAVDPLAAAATTHVASAAPLKAASPVASAKEKTKPSANSVHRADAGALRIRGWYNVCAPFPAAKAARDEAHICSSRWSRYRSGLNAERSSDANTVGSSHAAKCPPRSTSLK